MLSSFFLFNKLADIYIFFNEIVVKFYFFYWNGGNAVVLGLKIRDFYYVKAAIKGTGGRQCSPHIITE